MPIKRTLPKPISIDDLSDAHFYHRDNNKIMAGLRWKIKTDLGTERHETYQFSSVSDVRTAFHQFIEIEGMLEIEVLTYFHRKTPDGDSPQNQSVMKWTIQS